MYNNLISKLKKKSSKGKAKILSRFFKTGKGEYGEGDVFLGIVMPDQRNVAKQFVDLPFADVVKLLKSEIHECRMVALLILIQKYQISSKTYAGLKHCTGRRAEHEEIRQQANILFSDQHMLRQKSGMLRVQKQIFDLYIKNTKYINNWDLVDLSAPQIVGTYLLDKPRDILYTFAESKDLWKKRISIISTLTFIRQGDFGDTLKIAEMLLSDTHDLIHKAVGWMLREVGKKDEGTLRKFLDKHYSHIPRTALRYSIERFPEEMRLYYLRK
ncbi:MAG: DNA alkylation repair protein [bacterium]